MEDIEKLIEQRQAEDERKKAEPKIELVEEKNRDCNKRKHQF